MSTKNYHFAWFPSYATAGDVVMDSNPRVDEHVPFAIAALLRKKDLGVTENLHAEKAFLGVAMYVEVAMF